MSQMIEKVISLGVRRTLGCLAASFFFFSSSTVAGGAWAVGGRKRVAGAAPEARRDAAGKPPEGY